MNLFFSTAVEAGISDADIIFVPVNTPTKTFGQGAGKAADLQFWEKTARQILAHSTTDKIVVRIRPAIRTAEAMQVLHNTKMSISKWFPTPSLAEGPQLPTENPDRVLIGSQETPTGLAARKAIVDIYAHWVPRDRILESNVWSAELSKLTANAFLAQRISSINAISALCEKTQADVAEVAKAIGKDARIGAKFLQAGVGFGGSCFKKDILNLVYICHGYGLTEVAEYWESVIKINEWQENRFIRTMLENMFNTVAGKRIALFGFAFKADTGDTRESPALVIARGLLEERAQVVITDPKALDNARQDLHDVKEGLSFEADPYSAAEGAHAVALLIEQGYEVSVRRIQDRSWKRPAFVFDGRQPSGSQARSQEVVSSWAFQIVQTSDRLSKAPFNALLER